MFKTVAYADIFDYPLTVVEIKRWLIKGDSFAPAKKDFYYLPGRSNLVALRRRRKAYSRLKWQRAMHFTDYLKLIPWIKLVAVTGALAMNNSDQGDDIDLMIVTSANRLWLTRLLVLFFLSPYLRRGKKINNRLCLNLWLDETALAISRHDLYIAHEICQAKPIFERDNTYQKFIRANIWVKRYLPNALQGPTLKFNSPKGSDPIGFLESLAFRLQFWYMLSKMTSERVGRHFAFFHPRPTGKIVMEEYRKRLQGPTLKVRSEKGSDPMVKVLVTGCFDVFHSEHKKLLLAAKKLGGKLLVGVETDERVKKLKGPGRPVNPLAVRLENLRRLNIANEVFSLPQKFDRQSDYVALIRKIKPAILAVSAHTPHFANKQKIMKRFGGRVVVVLPHNPKISTTKLLKSRSE